MNYIMTMSLSGSCMVLLTLFLVWVARGKCTAKIQYLMLKISILYYLIPLPFLRDWYRNIAGYVAQNWIHMTSGEEIVFMSGDENRIIFVNNKFYFNDMLKISIILCVIWISVALIIWGYQVWSYDKQKKRLLECAVNEVTEEDKKIMAQLIKKYHIHRKVVLRKCPLDNIAFTVGCIRPVIFCSEIQDITEKEMLLQHELIHIKKWDMLWKFALILVLGIHWFNPVAWLLWFEMKRVCEFSCDEEVVEGRTPDMSLQYAGMLIKLAVKEKSNVKGIALSKEGKIISERMNRIMKTGEKRWSKRLSLLLVVGKAYW